MGEALTLTIAEYEERYVRPAVERWAAEFEKEHPEEMRRARRNLRRRLRRKGFEI